MSEYLYLISNQGQPPDFIIKMKVFSSFRKLCNEYKLPYNEEDILLFQSSKPGEQFELSNGDRVIGSFIITSLPYTMQKQLSENNIMNLIVDHDYEQATFEIFKPKEELDSLLQQHE